MAVQSIDSIVGGKLRREKNIPLISSKENFVEQGSSSSFNPRAKTE